jgi:hypothetical protein
MRFDQGAYINFAAIPQASTSAGRITKLQLVPLVAVGKWLLVIGKISGMVV